MINSECPRCGAPREPRASVCGTCRFEFATGDDGVVSTASETRLRLNRRQMGLAVGAILLGIGLVVIVVATISGRDDGAPTSGDPSGTPPPASSPASSTADASLTPRPSSVSTPTNAPPGPVGPLPDGAFPILPGQQPTDFVSSVTCPGRIGPRDPVAVVVVREAEVVLRDYAVSGSPTSVCEFAYENTMQLIDAWHLVIGGGAGAYAVVELPEVRYHWFQLPMDRYSTLIAVAPRLDQIVWLSEGVDPTDGMSVSRELHITTAAGDHVVALPNEPTGFCGAPLDYSKPGAFSPTGAHLFTLDDPRILSGGMLSSLRVFEGTTEVLSLVAPSGGWPSGGHPAMAIWSPTSETLYWRQGGDVWQWTPGGGSSVFLDGVNWFYPTITPDGRHVAYQDAQQFVHLLDLPGDGDPQPIGEAREKPVFLNDTQLWYTSPNTHGCAGGGEVPVVYDIVSGSEFPSIIDRVRLVWPATSAWY